MTPTSRNVQVFGIIPAAGMSRRMGRTKQTLAYRDSTITGTVARTLLDAGLAGVVVVTRTELVEALDLPSDPRLSVAINNDADSEMIDSIRIGLESISTLSPEPQAEEHPDLSGACAESPDPRAENNPDLSGARAASPQQTTPPSHSDTGVLVVPGDMPSLSVKTCRACVAAFIADPARIVIATHKGKRGHPIVFPLSLRSTLDQVTDGLRSLPQMHPERVSLLKIDDPGTTRDIDTPEDYEQP